MTAHIALQRVGAKADDWFQIMLTYPKLHVILGAGMLVSGGTQRFTLHGSRASLVKRDVDVQENQLRAGMVPRDLDWGIDLDAATLFDGATGETELVTAIDGDYCRFYDAVRDALTEGTANPVSPPRAWRRWRYWKRLRPRHGRAAACRRPSSRRRSQTSRQAGQTVSQ